MYFIEVTRDELIRNLEQIEKNDLLIEDRIKVIEWRIGHRLLIMMQKNFKSN